ncbi:ferritin [Sphingobacterium alkalisoli]|uniref:Ferritin n=1 Tax=Sphingobacterium alkalisoli TaxID=1874115 RepID=A0A4V5LY81_9SPHI|nr:ferritin [Sphingobacterium alkalisoli]TJY65579.1 ferritin [Sphingobacterium alkalisoli]GGH19619.1 putative bacterial non-heme ferritin [Sphingobacterium alkalisoli]
MKDLLKLKSSLSENIETILNAQIKVEAHSSALYLAMSAWCDDQGLDNASEFFAKQSDEERTHMLKLFNYVSNRGGRAISPEITNIPVDFESFRGVFEQTLEQEMFVTEQFNNIADQCAKSKDYVTFNFVQWFLEEQVEEEYVARRILELFDVIGEEGTGRWEIDRHLVKVVFDGE